MTIATAVSSRTVRLVVFAVIACLLHGPALADIQLSGSSTILPVVKKAAAGFEAETGIRVRAKGGGSSVGARSAIAGTVDLGMVSRALHAEEAEKLVAHTFAQDGVAVIANSANPIGELTREHIAAMFMGRVVNWKYVGWKDEPVVLVVKEEGRSTKELFEKFFAIEGKEPKDAHVIGSNAEAIVFVAGDPSAIGYVSIGTAEHAVSSGVHLKLIALEGAAATVDNVRNESYPLRRPLNLVSAGEPNPESRRFIDFVLGPKGQAIARDLGFVPVGK